jgi:hypothetical protein
LAQTAINQYHYDSTVFLSQVEGQHGQVNRLLYVGWGQDDRAVVAVPAAVHDLVVITL